jgi:tetratricopeptide (TPR) repeat protein
MEDVGGKIRLVVCTLSSARKRGLDNATRVSQVVNALPARVKVLLLTDKPSAFSVTPPAVSDRLVFVKLPDNAMTTLWPQDPFLVLRDESGIRLLASKQFLRDDDHILAEYVARHLGVKCDSSALGFAGGNIVSDGKRVFIGADTITRNAAALKQSAQQITESFTAELGREVAVIGTSPQAIAHIDMVLTPLGGRRMLVADLAWGARLAEEALRENASSVQAFERRCMRTFFGHAEIERVRTAGGGAYRPPEVVGQTRRAVADSRSLAEETDRLAQELARKGYTVKRVPFLSVHAASTGESPRRGQSADYPTLTYNNVLLEGTRRVYLPQYGFDVLDKAAKKAWRDLGWEIQPIGALTVSAMHQGSVRCCVKVLDRDDTSGTADIPPLPVEIVDATLSDNLGLALESKGRFDDTVTHFQRALKLMPDDAKVHNHLGRALASQGNATLAINHFEHALRVDPDYARALLNLGVVLRRVGRTREAGEHLREALRKDPSLALAHLNLAQVLEEEGKLEEAQHHYGEAKKMER